MDEILLEIDGKKVKAKEGITILEAARSVGIDIPTLCHHEKLSPYTGCRICTVEIEAKGRTYLDTACSHPVEKNIVVKTKSDNVVRVRKILLELMLAHAPEAKVLQDLAKEYGANRDRFEKEPSFCILCGLCVRYCAEVKRKNCVAFVGRGVGRKVVFIPEIAAKECWSCRECFSLCPTEALQASFLLTEALMFPSPSSEPELNSSS